MPTPKHPAPKDHTDWPEPVVRAFHIALGEFLQTYGSTEAGLLFLVDRYASGLLADDVNKHTPPTEFWARTQVQSDVVRALVGSRRAAVTSDTLKILLRISGLPDDVQDTASEALGQFGHIANLRNRIVHGGARPIYSAKWLFRTGNIHEVKERSKAQEYTFEIEDLEKMDSDLKRLRLRLGVCTLTDNPQFKDFADQNGAFEPWQYKPIQPIGQDRTRRNARESNPLQPLPPFELAFSLAASYPMSHGGPLVYAGEKRPSKMD